MLRLFFTFILSVFVFQLHAQDLTLELFVQGLNSPVEMTHVGDERMFVVEQTGKIKIVHPDGSINPIPFLDISSLISTGGERGLLGLAFPPDYNESGRFYVNYTNTNGNTVVARYMVSSDPDVAQNSGTILLTINQPYSNHNGGCLRFGPDGYLWIASGDGGSGGDPNGNGQNTNVLLGKLLRIDVSGQTYSIPADNPFANGGGEAEVWAYGLRNPWKFSFDSETNQLWIADVGQSEIEEINCQPHTAPGLNYGWRCYEGNEPYDTTGCDDPGEMIFPVAFYDHSAGRCSISGGFVYRGGLYPNLIGKYIFGDYCSGEIGWIDHQNNLSFLLNSGINITSFGEDMNGELYVLGSGKIYKIIGQTMKLDETGKNEIRVFPNPFKDYLNIQTETKSKRISVFSTDGKLLKELNTEDNKILLSDLRPDLYIIKVMAGKQKSVFKILKE